MVQNPNPMPEDAFAALGRGGAGALARVLRPLAWIDGLITATVVSPRELEEELWFSHVCIESDPGSLTVSDSLHLADALRARCDDIAVLLVEDRDAYQPFFGDNADRLAAAADWAAGFRFGMCLQPEPWAPLIDDDNARSLLSLIFCLERDEDLTDAERAASPFADIAPGRREEMRRISVDQLATAVVALHEYSGVFAADHDDGMYPFERPTPKVGRNEPCPCGSGKKYKKCCLGRAAWQP